MREVERQICTAIRYRSNAGCGNSMVCHDEKKNEARIYLHGNLVSTINHRKRTIKLNSCGYETNTTKSRLNVALSAIGTDYQVRQRNHKWEVYSSTDIKPFKDGMTLSY